MVSTLTNDNTSLSYTFSSTEGGTITVGGGCSSDNDTAVADNMTVSFAALPDGTYGGCYIDVTDSAGNTVRIYVNQFTIDTIAPILAQVVAVTTPTNDNSTLNYTFSSTEDGNINYGGSCSSDNNTSVGGPDNSPANNAITFNALADGTYNNNCKISVTDNLSNTSDNLSVSPFTIDITAPTLLDNLTIASNNTLNTTLAKTDDNITLSITSSEAIQTPTVEHCRSGCNRDW